MSKIKKQDKQKVIVYLKESYGSVTAEAAAKELDISYKKVHRIFAQLRSEGWGITPYNFKPYWKRPILNRGREKGDRYCHDRAESDWERTRFTISLPNQGKEDDVP